MFIFEHITHTKLLQIIKNWPLSSKCVQELFHRHSFLWQKPTRQFFLHWQSVYSYTCINSSNLWKLKFLRSFTRVLSILIFFLFCALNILGCNSKHWSLTRTVIFINCLVSTILRLFHCLRNVSFWTEISYTVEEFAEIPVCHLPVSEQDLINLLASNSNTMLQFHCFFLHPLDVFIIFHYLYFIDCSNPTEDQ